MAHFNGTNSKEERRNAWIQRANEIHNHKYNYNEVDYIDAFTKVNVVCEKHGNFRLTPSKHVSGKQGCYKCWSDERRDMWIKQAQEIHANRYNYDNVQYVNFTTKVEVVCNQHGSFWVRPDEHIIKHPKIRPYQGCRKCFPSNIKLVPQQYFEKASNIHSNKYDYTESIYMGSEKPITIKCKLHGDFVISEASRHINRGRGCLKCSKHNSSAEQIICGLLDQSKIEYEYQKRFDDLFSHNGTHLVYDFFIPSLNLLIEFDGAQHFTPNTLHHRVAGTFDLLQLHDKKKNKYAKDNGYRLYRIKYTECKHLDSIIHTLIKSQEIL